MLDSYLVSHDLSIAAMLALELVSWLINGIFFFFFFFFFCLVVTSTSNSPLTIQRGHFMEKKLVILYTY